MSNIPRTDFALDPLGRPITWHPRSFPITVVISTEFDDYEVRTIIKGIEYWNEQVGHRILSPVVSGSNSVRLPRNQIVVIKQNIPHNCQRQTLGLTTWLRRRIRTGENVTTNIVASRVIINKNHRHDRTYLRTAVHEIGHALGLLHDKNRNSVIYPAILSSDWFIEPEDIVVIRNAVSQRTAAS